MFYLKTRPLSYDYKAMGITDWLDLRVQRATDTQRVVFVIVVYAVATLYLSVSYHSTPPEVTSRQARHASRIWVTIKKLRIGVLKQLCGRKAKERN